jgi:hypothetical protein
MNQATPDHEASAKGVAGVRPVNFPDMFKLVSEAYLINWESKVKAFFSQISLASSQATTAVSDQPTMCLASPARSAFPDDGQSRLLAVKSFCIDVAHPTADYQIGQRQPETDDNGITSVRLAEVLTSIVHVQLLSLPVGCLVPW